MFAISWLYPIAAPGSGLIMPMTESKMVFFISKLTSPDDALSPAPSSLFLAFLRSTSSGHHVTKGFL